MSKDTDTKVKPFYEMDYNDIDLSDIPEMTREKISHCMIRFPNKPIGQGGEWHKPIIKGEMSDEQLAALKERAYVEWKNKEGQQEALPQRELHRVAT